MQITEIHLSDCSSYPQPEGWGTTKSHILCTNNHRLFCITDSLSRRISGIKNAALKCGVLNPTEHKKNIVFLCANNLRLFCVSATFLINILPLLPKETHILVEDKHRKTLFLHNNTLTDLSETIDIPVKNLSRYRSGKRPIPVQLFLKLVNLQKMPLPEFQERMSVKLGKNGSYLKIGPHLTINENWVYVAELLRGDGHLEKSLWNIVFVNKEKTLITAVEDFFINVGVPKSSSYLRTRPDSYFLTIRSKLAATLFHKIFDIPVGAKGDMNIPYFIKENKEFALALLRGFFDAEGCVSSGRITLSSNSLSYSSDCIHILRRFNILPRIYNRNSSL